MRGLLLTLLALLPWAARGAAQDTNPERGKVLFKAGEVADFELTDQLGRPFTRQDMAGRYWVVDFIFTYCAGPCPRMTEDMRRLQGLLQEEDVGLISFSVDPERDTPEVLKAYADGVGADHDKWFFLTGDKSTIFQLAANSFFLPVEDPEDTDQVIHSTRFVVVDTEGWIRGYHDQQSDTDPKLGVIETLEILRKYPDAEEASDVAELPVNPTPAPEATGRRPHLSRLPDLNALLNGGAAMMLIGGLMAIRRKYVSAHRNFMLGAVLCSVCFLVSYLTFHYQYGSVKYAGEGAMRTFYLGMLLTHTVLAALNVPLVVITLWHAFHDHKEKHRRIARWTLPVWLYVSVTGVLIYWMLYHGPGRGW